MNQTSYPVIDGSKCWPSHVLNFSEARASCASDPDVSATHHNMSRVEVHSCPEGACDASEQGTVHDESISNCSRGRTGPSCEACLPGQTLRPPIHGICEVCEANPPLQAVLLAMLAVIVCLIVWLLGYRDVWPNNLAHKCYDRLAGTTNSNSRVKALTQSVKNAIQYFKIVYTSTEVRPFLFLLFSVNDWLPV